MAAIGAKFRMAGSGSLDGMAMWNGTELDGLVLQAGTADPASLAALGRAPR